MSGDLLKFRFPDEQVTTLSGSFRESNDSNISKGFFVTNFTANRKYVFVEQDLLPQEHYAENTASAFHKEEYLRAGRNLLNEFKRGRVEKAVLSRQISLSGKRDPLLIFDRLCESYPKAFVYLVSSSLFGTWIGASPELLLKSDGNHKNTVALAGTKSLEGGDWTAKELDEHRYVVEFINSMMESFSPETVRFNGPFEVTTGVVRHLKTEVDFYCDADDFQIVSTLHPTPAVAGTPRDEALKLIAENELGDRALYTGMIGFIGDKTHVYVNLRCMQLFENSCVLYVGGGWTVDSDPESEWEETENKARTLLHVLEMK